MSFSAPLMAGMLATILASDNVPFSTTPGQLVPAAKKYLIDHANWETNSIKTIWNEVDEEHNPPNGGTISAPPSPVLTSGSPPFPTSQTSSPLPATAPYAQGVCGIHVWQVDRNGMGDYTLEINMTDHNHASIGYVQPMDANPTHPLDFQSKLEDVLVCIPEKQNDYIQFSLGAQQWPSNGKSNPGAVPSCKEGTWDNGAKVVG